MAAKNIAVFGMYRDRASFEYAFCALKASGIRDTDISALTQHNPKSTDRANGEATRTPNGPATANGSGAAIGAALGWLPVTSQLVVPGLGVFLVAGPLAGTLSGIATGGTAGGPIDELTEALLGLGIPVYEASRHQKRIRNGGILLSVHCDDPDCIETATKSLRSTGAENISSVSGHFVD